jgi:DNA-directed RNA polymerase subunit RPC12/RpoP
MENFVCLNCKFKFSANNPKTCPYCSKRTVEKERSAAEIVDEVMNMTGE